MWFAESGLLRVGLSARELVLARGRAREADCRTIPCARTGRDDPAQPWQTALQELGTALTRWPEAERPKRMEVVLSNRLVRWQLVDMPLEAASAEEQNTLARQCLHAIYGARSEGWVVRLADQPAGRKQAVCAMDQALLDALQALAAAHRIQLVSVAPYLARAHDHWRRHLRAPSYWLVQLEPDALTLALVLQRRWCALRTVQQAEPVLSDLSAQLAQMGLAAGWSGDTLPLYLINSSQAVQLARPQLQTTTLEPEVPALRTAPMVRLAWGL